MSTTLPRPATTQQDGLVAALSRHGDRPAVVHDGGTLSYVELARQVAAVSSRLGPARRLVLLEGENTLPCLVGYLGALAAGCPVLLVPPAGAADCSRLVATYDPDVVMRTTEGALVLDEVRSTAAHDLHPDLALLLSTSGSSGSPKLVRLSRRNLHSNAAAIAEALGIRDTDRAMTTLPLHYCYGLSVVHSHLLAGAALVLTRLSVVDPCFWRLFARAGATTFAAVPYTFDLLDTAGFSTLHLPTLRYVTQAGGRLAPERVQAYARLGAERGWDLVVMYGQTEATARMAVLPPELAARRPTAIGLPVPGGRFELEPVEVDEQQPDTLDADVGQLVYTGPNVMLGYATSPADLALGPCVDRLRTGDLARRGADGLYEVVGRRARFLKLFGLRIDQGHVEEVLRGQGVTACCEPATGGRLGVLVEGRGDPSVVLRRVLAGTGLPPHAVVVRAVDRLPRRPSGKPDLAAVRDALAVETPPPSSAAGVDLRSLFAEVLDVHVDGRDTFVGLGGDSLSYVEMSMRLERALGRLPAGWQTTTVDELGRAALDVGGQSRSRATMDATVALRAVAILLVVGSHAKLFDLLGGAHVLLLLAGYNLARFQLAAERRRRVRAVARSVGRVFLPAAAWIAAVTVATGQYAWPNVLLLNHLLGPDEWGPTWSLWYLEALVVLLLLTAAGLALDPVDRWQRRWPFGFPLVLVSLGLLVRFDVLPVPTGPGERFTAQALLWLFALGWAAAVARTAAQRLLVVGIGAVCVLGWFGDGQREAVLLLGLVVLVGVARVPSTPWLTWVASALASSSLYVYVTHWQVYPLWQHTVPLLSFAASLAVGLLYWQVVGRVQQVAARWRGGGVLGVPVS